MMKWKIVALLASLLALPAMAADDYKTIDWDVLIPQGEKIQPPPPINHDGNFASVPQPVGGVNKKLNEQNVRLPGFVVPLEGDAKKITAFIKTTKIKVQGSIQGDEVRVTGKNIDDLQSTIQLLKKEFTDLPLEYGNFRD
jgi:hypothetical protein